MEAYYSVIDHKRHERDEDDRAYYHLVLLSMNNEGLHNLIKLSSLGYTEGLYYKPRISDILLADLADNVIATSSCLGSRASQLLLRNESAEAERLITHHAQIFKDRFFIELQLHKGDQQIVNEGLIKIAKKHNLPMILSQDCHYMYEHDKDFHEIALKMATSGQGDGFSFGEIDVHVASHDWMWEKAQKYNIPYEAIANTVYVSNMIDSDSYFIDRKNRWPRYPNLPPGLKGHEALENLAKNKLMERFDNKLPPAEYRERLVHELKVLKRLDVSDYMLIMYDIIKAADEVGCPTGPGRGSAAGSLVSYALGITHIDPIKYKLFFERFIHDGRSAIPLIFDQEMINKVKEMNHHEHKCSHNH